jgi:hypothetical protein
MDHASCLLGVNEPQHRLTIYGNSRQLAEGACGLWYPNWCGIFPNKAVQSLNSVGLEFGKTNR